MAVGDTVYWVDPGDDGVVSRYDIVQSVGPMTPPSVRSGVVTVQRDYSLNARDAETGKVAVGIRSWSLWPTWDGAAADRNKRLCDMLDYRRRAIGQLVKEQKARTVRAEQEAAKERAKLERLMAMEANRD